MLQVKGNLPSILLDYKCSEKRINIEFRVYKGTIFILTYSYYCCTIKEKGKWKSDKCQGEKKLPEVPTVIKDCPLWESALSDWKLSAEINAKRYGSKC